LQFLFVDFLFKPLDWLRALELDNWWLANIINWVFVAICIKYLLYWTKELKIFKQNHEDEQDTTAHSFLK
jgi:hypothetical protein